MRLLLLAFLYLIIPSSLCSTTHFVLLGSLGDLARKYLWSALHVNYAPGMRIYGASRNAPEEGRVMLAEILEQFPRGMLDKEIKDWSLRDLEKVVGTATRKVGESVPKSQEELVERATGGFQSLVNGVSNLLSSGKEYLSEKVPKLQGVLEEAFNNPSETQQWVKKLAQSKSRESRELISNLLSQFSTFHSSVEYLQLKTEAHFQELCSRIPSSDSLIFYFSIPPSAYVSTAQLISRHCHNPRIAIEKPFGYSKSSAQELFSGLESLIPAEEIYLVDHYLGKTISQQIPQIINSPGEPGEISRIEVSLMEMLDCKGRAGYYDDSGVFRDMLQNHATELLLLLAGGRSKVEVLESLSRPNKHQVIIGQYQSYSEHVGKATTTPTFASVVLFSSLPEWAGVPILLSSGKSQEAERKEVKVTFRSGRVLEFGFKPPRVTFDGTSLLPDDITISQNSYEVLLRNVLTGNNQLLPTISSTLASWDLWDGIISLPHTLHLHPDNTNLPVTIAGKFLLTGEHRPSLPEPSHSLLQGKVVYRDSEEAVYRHVAEELGRVVEEAAPGEPVHVGLSGGSTVVGIFKYLVGMELSWERVHLWQVDERCEEGVRNAGDLHHFLVEEVESLRNVHLLPTSPGEACGSGLDQFQRDFATLNPARRFDFVILGVGSDGHVASLFPHSTTLHSTNDFLHIHTPTAPVSPHRLTVTLDLINRSRRVVVVVVGEGKRLVVDRVREGDDSMPVARVTAAEILTWYVQQELL